MPRGGNSRYSNKQKRTAEHIEEGYERRAIGKGEAERRAWATVNRMTGGGRKEGGSDRDRKANKAPARQGGRLGGKAAAQGPAAARSASARKAAARRKSGRNSR
ncbi:MAG: plasmid stabilization protein [Dongiaceae bacterium]